MLTALILRYQGIDFFITALIISLTLSRRTLTNSTISATISGVLQDTV